MSGDNLEEKADPASQPLKSKTVVNAGTKNSGWENNSKIFKLTDDIYFGPSYEKAEARSNQILRVPRHTTDVCALAVFAVYTVFMALVWCFAVNNGQYNYLKNGRDWRGQACGAGDLNTKMKQAWINPLMSDIWAGAICVDACPAPADGAELDTHSITCVCNEKFWPEKLGTVVSSERSQDLIIECARSSARTAGYFTKIVSDGDAILKNVETGTSGDAFQPCAFTHRTTWAMHKCVPWISDDTLPKIITQQQPKIVTTDYVTDWLAGPNTIFSTFVNDVVSTLHLLGLGLVITAMLGMLALVGLKYADRATASVATWGLLVLYIASAVVTFSEHSSYSEKVDTIPRPSTYIQDAECKMVYLVLFILSIVAAVVHLAASIFLAGTMRDMAISIIKIATKTFEDAPALLLYPLIHLVSFAAMITLWLIGAIMLYCSGTVTIGSNGIGTYDHTPHVRASAPFYLFGLLWWSGFMNAMGYMIVSCTIYMTSFAYPKDLTDPDGEKRVPHSAMTEAACIVTRYHMGTAALGSVVMLTTAPFRLLVNSSAKHEEVDDREHSCLRKLLCSPCDCSTYAYNSFFKYLNRMAFLQTILHGWYFFDGAFKGLQCVMLGITDISPSTFGASFVLFTIKMSISLMVTGCSYFTVYTGGFAVSPADLSYSWVPYLLIFFCSFVFCTAFMLIFETAIDGIMVAYCEAHYEPNGAFTKQQISTALKMHMAVFAKNGAYSLEAVHGGDPKSKKIMERDVYDEQRALLAGNHHPCPGSDGSV